MSPKGAGRRGIHDRFEIADHSLKREVCRRAIGEPEAPSVVADERRRARSSLLRLPQVIDLPLKLNVRDWHRWRIHQRRPATDRVVRDAHPVGRLRVPDLRLFHAGSMRLRKHWSHEPTPAVSRTSRQPSPVRL